MFKTLLVASVAIAALADECPVDKQVLCIDDIRQAYPVCEKAAESKGKDFVADLQCMKYVYKVEQQCWPCICTVIQKEGWKVKGCNALRFY